MLIGKQSKGEYFENTKNKTKKLKNIGKFYKYVEKECKRVACERQCDNNELEKENFQGQSTVSFSCGCANG